MPFESAGHRCAQRLSASKIGSRRTLLAGVGRDAVLNACRRQRSVHTSPGRTPGAPSLVLNACRRQRSVHGRRHGVVRGLRLVLNACRRQRSVHNVAAEDLEQQQAGAQRLSASKIGSLLVHVAAADHVPVLNACRRQRSVHEVGRPRRSAVPYVLNACRRQRSVHATCACHGLRSGNEWRAQRLSASKIGSRG